MDERMIADMVIQHLRESIKNIVSKIEDETQTGNRVETENPYIVLFSGGIDSVIITKLLTDELERLHKTIRPAAYTTVVDGQNIRAKDREPAKYAAQELGIPHTEIVIKYDELEGYIIRTIDILINEGLSRFSDQENAELKVSDWVNVIKVGVGVCVLAIAERIKKPSHLFSGLGSEELFAGYQRHELAEDVNEECRKGLSDIEDKDLARDRAIARKYGHEIHFPFLYRPLIDYSLRIPPDLKIRDGYKKYILRLGCERIGLPKEIVWRKKLAAQYGSGVDRGIQRLAKESGFRYKSEYIKHLVEERIPCL